MTEVHVLVCPFCGRYPEALRWHGGGPRKTMIACRAENCDVAPSVTGSTPKRAENNWNVQRFTSQIMRAVEVAKDFS